MLRKRDIVQNHNHFKAPTSPKRMNILVTGGAGFIGCNVVAELLQRGHQVTVLDDLSFGRKENLQPVLHNITFIQGSITDEEIVRKACQNMHVIINLAAASASPMFSLANIRKAVHVNIDGFLLLLKVAVEQKVKRVLYASTSSIYGNNFDKLHEQSTPLPPNMYAATKLGNEYFASVFSQEYELETIGFRFLSVYGPHEESKGKYANLASQFLWAALQEQSLVIYGDGSQKRDFTYVKDVAQALALGAESNKKHLAEVLNVASGQSHSLNELVFFLNQLLGKKIQPQYIPNPVKNYIVSQDADISKIQQVLSYKPKFLLPQGLQDMYPSVKLAEIRKNT